MVSEDLLQLMDKSQSLIRENSYNDALLDVLTYVIDVRDYKTRKAILNLWKDKTMNHDRSIQTTDSLRNI